MDVGNFMVGYNHPAYNVVLMDAGVAPTSNDMTLGLRGKSLMFRDADAPVPYKLIRATA